MPKLTDEQKATRVLERKAAKHEARLERLDVPEKCHFCFLPGLIKDADGQVLCDNHTPISGSEPVDEPEEGSAEEVTEKSTEPLVPTSPDDEPETTLGQTSDEGSLDETPQP
jgi:hypothetical protein